MTIPHIPFYFIRHGQTDWNLRGVYMGTSDIPLNEAGIEQAKLATQLLKREPINHIITSPLLRAAKTAEIIAKIIEKPITIMEDLKECCWGIKEGMPVDADAIFDQWIDGDTPKGAEAAHDFDERVKRGLKDALALSQQPSQLVLIVGHGGVFCSIQRTLSAPLNNIKNCIPVYYRPPNHAEHSWSLSYCGIN
ncbi:MAG: histidine phosphatase family protein [Candidatus Paracaedibacteraceae bacterium]|nr:histidine phosphatase family protein [Candidatus Paracaedibacteraceae bacterium]